MQKMLQHTGNCAPEFVVEPVGADFLLGEHSHPCRFSPGFPRPTYRWLFNGVILPGETNYSLSLPNVTFDRQEATSWSQQ